MAHREDRHIEFRSVNDFVDYTDGYEPPKGAPSAKEGSLDWYGGTFEDGQRLARFGWTEGAEQVREMRDRITALIPEARGAQFVPTYDACGDELDTGVYFTGVPEHMIRPELQHVKKGGKVITVLVSPNKVTTVAAESCIIRGAAITLLVDQLEAAGYRVGIDVLSVNDTCNGRATIAVTVKQPDQALDLDAVAYCLAHPTFHRRLDFRTIEKLYHGLPVDRSLPIGDIRKEEEERHQATLTFHAMRLSREWVISNAWHKVLDAARRAGLEIQQEVATT